MGFKSIQAWLLVLKTRQVR